MKISDKHPVNKLMERNLLYDEMKALSAKEQIQVIMNAKGFTHGKGKKKKKK